MSTEPTTPQQASHTDVEEGRSATRAPIQFPRLELPPVPIFREPRIPADELPVVRPLRDEPAPTWQAPFPTPEVANTYAFQVVPPPPPAQEAVPFPVPVPVAAPVPAPASMPVPAPAAAPAPTPSRVPALTPTAPAVEETATAAGPTDVSKVTVAIFALTAILLVWASRMAFSPALLAMSGLLVSEAAIGLARTGARGSSRPTSATIGAGVSIVLALLALKGAFGGFSEMAFVASLFVLVAALPTLLLLGAAEVALRRRRNPSPADEALRAGTRFRFGAVVALLASGYLAKDSFSAKPDTFVAFALVALVAWNAVQVLRGTGRAARD